GNGEGDEGYEDKGIVKEGIGSGGGDNGDGEWDRNGDDEGNERKRQRDGKLCGDGGGNVLVAGKGFAEMEVGDWFNVVREVRQIA
uniref:hypothetical protein n=1 Tax=Geobacillus sp. (strain Y412MC10) TaxID=481743 RepID=UPI0037CBF4D2